MLRFDLLDEFTCVATPKFSPARDREPEHREARGGNTGSGWRYGITGIVAILVLALVAL